MNAVTTVARTASKVFEEGKVSLPPKVFTSGVYQTFKIHLFVDRIKSIVMHKQTTFVDNNCLGCYYHVAFDIYLFISS